MNQYPNYPDYSDYPNAPNDPHDSVNFGNFFYRGKENEFFKEVEKTLPPVFSREYASKVIGGLLSAKTMSNEDSLGKGPSKKVKVGNKIGYTREAFMEWLRTKVR